MHRSVLCSSTVLSPFFFFFFFFNDTATTEIYTLSLHDALPILTEGGELTARLNGEVVARVPVEFLAEAPKYRKPTADRKSTRLNSSHSQISYAVFCLKKKKKSTHPALQLHQRHCTSSTWRHHTR